MRIPQRTTASPQESPAPAPKPKFPKKRCLNCDKKFEKNRPNRKFCQQSCKDEYNRHGSAFGPLKTRLERIIKLEVARRLQDAIGDHVQILREMIERHHQRLYKADQLAILSAGAIHEVARQMLVTWSRESERPPFPHLDALRELLKAEKLKVEPEKTVAELLSDTAILPHIWEQFKRPANSR